MAIFPRDPTVDVRALAAALNDVDWADLGFVCDGRFLFTSAVWNNHRCLKVSVRSCRQ